MPKQLVIEPCLINHGDDRGGVDYATGDIVDVPKDTANTLARAGRTLYIDKKEDPDKHGRYTATRDMIAAAQEMAKAKVKAKAEPKAPVTPPPAA